MTWDGSSSSSSQITSGLCCSFKESGVWIRCSHGRGIGFLEGGGGGGASDTTAAFEFIALTLLLQTEEEWNINCFENMKYKYCRLCDTKQESNPGSRRKFKLGGSLLVF